MIPTNLHALPQRNRYKHPSFLPDEYIPSKFDVLCGKGNKAANHIGNLRFKVTISIHLSRYSESTSRAQKTAIVSEVVELVRQKSPGGGFVKYERKSNKWYEVGDHVAREKVSQAFRDMLHDRYESSKITKKKKRQAAKAMLQYPNDLRLVGGLCTISEESSGEIGLSKMPNSLRLTDENTRHVTKSAIESSTVPYNSAAVQATHKL